MKTLEDKVVLIVGTVLVIFGICWFSFWGWAVYTLVQFALTATYGEQHNEY